MQASALVVGIDGYDHVDPLTGSVQDALEAAQWLLGMGIDPDRIRLHVAPATGATASPPADVQAKPATRDAIWSSLTGIKDESGDRLYVFLSGHGYYLAATGPIFLCQDWSANFSDKNLDILSYAAFLRSLRFRDQFFVVDACQNYATDPIYRSPINPSVPPGAWTPNPQNGLTLCCAASQGQFAVITDGRGLLIRNMLSAINAVEAGDTPAVARDAIVFDWQLGTRSLDLRRLFEYVVSPAVVAAAAKLQASQTPTIQPHGRAMGERDSIVLDLPGSQLVPLNISAAALEGVDSVRVEMRPPVRELNLPPVPFAGRVPFQSRVIASCVPRLGWDASPPRVDTVASGEELKVDFTLTQARASPELAEYNLRVVNPSGEIISPLTHKEYAAVGVVADSEGLLAGQPRIQRHEHGPDLSWVGVEPPGAASTAERLREMLTDQVAAASPGTEVFLSPPGMTVSQSRPNLRINLPLDTAKIMAGYLGREPLIKIERIGGHDANDLQTRSIDQLLKRALLHVEPGCYRIIAEMPWGTGVTQVEVPPEGLAACDIPTVDGRQPLRNQLAVSSTALQLHHLGTVSGSSYLWVIPDPRDSGETPRLFVPGAPSLNGGVNMLLEREGGFWRAEPFSHLPWVEWDLLIGAGRLVAVDLDAAYQRLNAQGNDSVPLTILRLALAYAAHAQRNPVYKQAFLTPLRARFGDIPDILLLSDSQEGPSPVPQAMPLFRWGVPLLMHRAPQTSLPGVLSPASTWTVFDPTLGEHNAPQTSAGSVSVAHVSAESNG